MNVRTAHVGSLPKSLRLRRIRARVADGELDETALRDAEDREVVAALRLQSEVGLDELTDGHVDRGDLVTGLTRGLEGVDIAGPVRVSRGRYVQRPIVRTRVVRPSSITVDRWKFASDRAECVVRATLPSPYTLALGCLDEHHASRAQAVEAFTAVLVDEVGDLVAAGAEVLQLDEIGLGARDDEVDLAIDALRSVVGAAGASCRVWLRLSYVDPTRVRDELARLPLRGIHVPYPRPGSDTAKWVAGLSPDLELGLGVVSADEPDVESTDAVVDAVQLVARGRDSVWLGPDAGLQGLPLATARGKLDVVAAAAGRLMSAP